MGVGNLFLNTKSAILMVLSLALFLGGGAYAVKTLQAPTCPPSGKPLDWVHDPERLQVLSMDCELAHGWIVSRNDDQRGEDGELTGDGDLRFVLLLARDSWKYSNQDDSILDPKCVGDNHCLYLEVVPAYRKRGVGDGVEPVTMATVRGTWVLDTAHGWNEFHPATSIKTGSWD